MEKESLPNMTDKDANREDSAMNNPVEETPARPAQPTEEPARKGGADQAHGRQLELLRQSLAAEGEVAYERWGLALFHSLSDEEVEAQRITLGVEPKDALDFYNRGCLLAQREDFAGAAKAFERAGQLDANLADAFYNRALALESAGDKSAARQAWQGYLERFGESEEAAEVRQHLEALAQG